VVVHKLIETSYLWFQRGPGWWSTGLENPWFFRF